MDIAHIEYSEGVLVVRLCLAKDNAGVSVEFREVDGFRLLDEGNLLESWPECSSPNGRLFEITSGGWLSQERHRSGSLVGPMNTPLREFLLTGSNECVSVLAFCEPVLHADAP